MWLTEGVVPTLVQATLLAAECAMFTIIYYHCYLDYSRLLFIVFWMLFHEISSFSIHCVLSFSLLLDVSGQPKLWEDELVKAIKNMINCNIQSVLRLIRNTLIISGGNYSLQYL